MQVGKQDLVFAQHRTLIELRFLDLDDQVGGGEYLLRRCQHTGTGFFILAVCHADAHSCPGFDEDLVAIVRQFPYAGWRQANAKFQGFDFLWNTYLHNSSPYAYI